MTAVIAISLLIGGAVGLIAGIVFYLLGDKGPDTAERDPDEPVPVPSDLDGSHDNLDDVDQVRWVEEVMWLTEQYEADEVPIIPGRLPGEGR